MRPGFLGWLLSRLTTAADGMGGVIERSGLLSELEVLLPQVIDHGLDLCVISHALVGDTCETELLLTVLKVASHSNEVGHSIFIDGLSALDLGVNISTHGVECGLVAGTVRLG